MDVVTQSTARIIDLQPFMRQFVDVPCNIGKNLIENGFFPSLMWKNHKINEIILNSLSDGYEGRIAESLADDRIAESLAGQKQTLSHRNTQRVTAP